MRLFDLFSLYQNLPIRVQDIGETILERGFVGKITFHETTHGGEAISGMLYQGRLKAPYASNNGDNEVAHIITNASLTPSQRRVVATKELLHICDSEAATARTEGTVNRLISELTLPPELLAEIVRLRHETIADNVGTMRAVAVLFPKEIRDDLKPHYDGARISIQQIASLVDMPLEYANLVMSDQWEDLYKLLRGVDEELSKC